MSDIAIVWDNLFLTSDLKYENGDLIREPGLTTAYLMSIYTDKRASLQDKIDDINDRRGWWGDLTTDGDEIGSKLWLLDRSSALDENVNLAKSYIEESVQWAIDDGIASEHIVTTSRDGNKLIYQLVAKKDSDIIVSIKFLDLWNGQFQIN